MNKMKFKVSVGIPAYNEEANIKKLLLSLIEQKTPNFGLIEIIVVSDQSTDNTDQDVKSIKDKRITLIRNRKRIGQAMGQNKIVERFKSDILVLLNADILPYDKNFIANIIKPFQKDKKIGIVCPKMIPVPSDRPFGKITNFAAQCKWAIFESWNETNVMLCSGAARAFRKDLIKQMRWPKTVGEDAFSYFFCITNGYKFKYQTGAKIYYKPSENIKDQRRQTSRFLASKEEMTRFYPKELIEQSYDIPLRLKILYTFKYFLKNPFLMTAYLIYFLFVNLRSQKDKYRSVIWDVSTSSKKLSKT